MDNDARRVTLQCMSRSIKLLFVVLAFVGVGAYAAETAERVSVIQVPGASKIFKAQADKDGAIHLVFDSDDGPQYVQSGDAGATFSAPIGVVDTASRKPGLKFNAWDMAVGPDGRVHVAMGNNAWKLKLPKEEWAFYYASLAPKAKAFTPVRNLNRKSKRRIFRRRRPERRSHRLFPLWPTLCDVIARQWRDVFRFC